MNKKIRNGVALVISLALVLSTLSACGSFRKDGVPLNATTAEKKDSVTIKLAAFTVGVDPAAAFYKKIWGDFPNSKLGEGIKLQIEEIPGPDNYGNKMKLLITSGTLPDVIQNMGANIMDLGVQAGKLADLTPYFAADPAWKDTFDPKALEYNSRNGKIYGVPLGKELTFIYYNKDLFAKAGVQPPKTWDEFFQVCEKLKAAGITPYGMDTSEYGWFTSLLFGALMSSTDDGIKFMNTKFPTDYNQPFIIDAAKKLQLMYQKYTTEDAVGGSAVIASTHFYNGEVAMINNGPWVIPSLRDPKKVPAGFYNKVGIMPYPGNVVSDVPDLGEMVGATEKPKIDAAVKYLKYLTSLDNQVASLVATGKVPSSPMVQIPTDLKTKDPLLARAITVGNNASATIGENQAYWYPSVLDEMNVALPELAFGKITAEQFCQQLTDAAEKNN